jgi:hypothetical protein
MAPRKTKQLSLEDIETILERTVALRTLSDIDIQGEKADTLPEHDSFMIEETTFLQTDGSQDEDISAMDEHSATFTFSDLHRKKSLGSTRRRSRNGQRERVSSGSVVVSYPKTDIDEASVKVFGSRSEALSDIYSQSDRRLSNFFVYDSDARTIHPQSLSGGFPLDNIIQAHHEGKQIIWLPMQDDDFGSHRENIIFHNNGGAESTRATTFDKRNLFGSYQVESSESTVNNHEMNFDFDDTPKELFAIGDFIDNRSVEPVNRLPGKFSPNSLSSSADSAYDMACDGSIAKQYLGSDYEAQSQTGSWEADDDISTLFHIGGKLDCMQRSDQSLVADGLDLSAPSGETIDEIEDLVLNMDDIEPEKTTSSRTWLDLAREHISPSRKIFVPKVESSDQKCSDWITSTSQFSIEDIEGVESGGIEIGSDLYRNIWSPRDDQIWHSEIEHSIFSSGTGEYVDDEYIDEEYVDEEHIDDDYIDDGHVNDDDFGMCSSGSHVLSSVEVAVDNELILRRNSAISLASGFKFSVHQAQLCRKSSTSSTTEGTELEPERVLLDLDKGKGRESTCDDEPTLDFRGPAAVFRPIFSRDLKLSKRRTSDGQTRQGVRITTPSNATYMPSDAICTRTGDQVSSSSINRVPTPHSHVAALSRHGPSSEDTRIVTPVSHSTLTGHNLIVSATTHSPSPCPSSRVSSVSSQQMNQRCKTSPFDVVLRVRNRVSREANPIDWCTHPGGDDGCRLNKTSAGQDENNDENQNDDSKNENDHAAEPEPNGIPKAASAKFWDLYHSFV